MSFSQDTIDRIVANVLNQLGATSSAPAPTPASPVSVPPASPPQVTNHSAAEESPRVTLQQAVITASLLEGLRQGEVVQVPPKAIITPAANDIVRGKQLRIIRADQKPTASPSATAPLAKDSGQPLLIVVKSTKPLEQLWGELTGTWKRELVGCPDDAAKLTISEIARGSTSQILIVAEQPHRAACLANRNDRVKAVAIRDAGDIRLIRKQLRANTWCLDGTGKTYFEFKNLIREIQAR